MKAGEASWIMLGYSVAYSLCHGLGHTAGHCSVWLADPLSTRESSVATAGRGLESSQRERERERERKSRPDEGHGFCCSSVLRNRGKRLEGRREREGKGERERVT